MRRYTCMTRLQSSTTVTSAGVREDNDQGIVFIMIEDVLSVVTGMTIQEVRPTTAVTTYAS